MKNLKQAKSKLLLFLIAAIIILCVGFIIISCGDPEQKALDSTKGQCAIDCTRHDIGTTLRVDARNDNFPSIKGKELTVEAWIKPKAASTTGGIFGRYDGAGGVLIRVEDNIPKFSMTVMVASSSDPNVTSTVDYTVEGTLKLAENIWHHIAGVLVNDDHTNTSGDGDSHGECGGAEKEMPHLDLYVNGHFVDCAATWGDIDDTATGPQGVSDPEIADSLGGEGNLASIGYFVDLVSGDDIAFEGVIDEVRLWTVARTSYEIDDCMGRELSTSGGDCGINTNKLKGYWRFNECEHDKAMDWSGAGSSGFITVGPHEWDDGWVEGVRVNGALLPMD